MAKYLVTDKVHPSVKPLLEALGYEVDWYPTISNPEVYAIIDQYEGIIISSKTIINKSLIDKGKNLKIVGRAGSGMEHVDQAYCQEKGIVCLNSPEGNCNAVAEHAMAMLLALSNNLIRAHNEVNNSLWKRFENTGFELKGKTVGIIGYGYTGSAFAKKIKAFDTTIIIYDKYKNNFENEWVKEVNDKELMEQADIISFHIPYNEETHHWLNKEFLNSCQQKPIIINTSRGAIAKTEDLLWALQNEKIEGLCLDVFEDEPIDQNRIHPIELYKKLMTFDKVVVTPHIAGWSKEAKQQLVSVLVKKIEKTANKQDKQ